MPKDKKPNIRNELKKELKAITDTVDLDSLNNSLKHAGISKIEVSEKTLDNIAKWLLDGKSEFEIRQNLELNVSEWAYLLNTCPAIGVVMQHTTAYADMVVGATLFQTAIGGRVIKKKIPLKVREYVEGKVVGEHYEMIEIEETTQPNPLLLKYLAEHKLSEKLGDNKKDNAKEYKDIIDNMSEEEIKLMQEQRKD